MPKCREVAAAVASDELARRLWHQRLAIRLHLAMCRHCRRYAAQLAAIGAGARSLYASEALNEALAESILDSLRRL